MAETQVSVAARPIWIDLASTDPAGSREFYSKLFGWQIEVQADPQYGGYGLARIEGKDVAGIGGQMPGSEGMPSAWSIYVGTDDASALAGKVEAAGGKVVAQPMKIPDVGTMAVFQDPSGAFVSAYQPETMRGFGASGVANAYGWAELNARGFEAAAAFYRAVFGWQERVNPMGEGQPPYIEFLLGEDSVAGGMEMQGLPVPAEMPSHWTAYFGVSSVDAMFEQAIKLGAKEMIAPTDFPGGRFAVLSDPQGAQFGLLSLPS